jgi:hypothetical protein
MDIKKVLVFPCGSEIGLEIHRALEFEKYIELWGASSVVSNHGKFVYKNYINNLPFVDAANFIEKLNSTLVKNKIDFVFPAHDSVCLALSENQPKIKSKIIGSPYQTNLICRSKTKIYSLFANKLKVPKIYHSIGEIEQYPVFLKPDVGQGSKGTYIAHSKEEVQFYQKLDRSLLILEYLPGSEYTIDCFTNFKRELQFVGGRLRNRISNGIAVNSVPVENPAFYKIASIINDSLEFDGAWFFQLKEDTAKNLTLMEISPRIAGTMGLHRNKGINLPLLSFYNCQKIETGIINNDIDLEIDRALSSRFTCKYFYKTVYVDFDDCLILKNKINTKLVAFLYQCLNQNKEIILISRHGDKPTSDLKKYRLYHLFDKIIHIRNSDSKTTYITKKPAIFIDDSYTERFKVFSSCKIPVFAPDAIECLLNPENPGVIK